MSISSLFHKNCRLRENFLNSCSNINSTRDGVSFVVNDICLSLKIRKKNTWKIHLNKSTSKTLASRPLNNPRIPHIYSSIYQSFILLNDWFLGLIQYQENSKYYKSFVLNIFPCIFIWNSWLSTTLDERCCFSPTFHVNVNVSYSKYVRDSLWMTKIYIFVFYLKWTIFMILYERFIDRVVQVSVLHI